MKKTVLLKIVLAAVVLPLFAGCASPPPTNVGSQVATGTDVSGQPTEAPPANQKDVIPACPGSPAQWWFIDGHWDWRGKWVWVAGHWRVRPHPGDIWLPGKWVQQGNVYVWQKGRWRSGAPADEESNER